MGKLVDRFIKTRRRLIANERELSKVFNVLNINLPIRDWKKYRIVKLRWDNTGGLLYIYFPATNEQWYKIIKDLDVEFIEPGICKIDEDDSTIYATR